MTQEGGWGNLTATFYDLFSWGFFTAINWGISTATDTFEAHHNLGVLNDQLGFREKAEIYYSKARELRKK